MNFIVKRMARKGMAVSVWQRRGDRRVVGQAPRVHTQVPHLYFHLKPSPVCQPEVAASALFALIGSPIFSG
jgi:hypothetical protein